MSLIIKNAHILGKELANIFIKDDIIYDIGKKAYIADESIDARGNVVLPGVIDPHVHFRVPGMKRKEDWKTGSKAAAAGGVTTVLDMPNNNPPIVSRESLEEKDKIIQGNTYVNYGLFIGATEDNLEELKNCSDISAGIKIYLGSSTGDLLVADYEVVENIMRECNKIIAFHSEDEECLNKVDLDIDYNLPASEIHYLLRPGACAKKSAEKIISIFEKVKKEVYICHVSSKEEIKIFKQAKEKGLKIYLESTPHHLFLNKDSGLKLNNFAKVNPPLRCQESQEYLQESLISGVIDTIGTDHAPHTIEEKNREYSKSPSGFPGIEHSLALMLDFYNKGRISLERIVELMCFNPALIFNIKNRGKIEPGFYADIVVVDLNLTQTIKKDTLYTKCGWSPFEGVFLKGWPIFVIVNGFVVYNRGSFSKKFIGRNIFLD